MNPAESSLRRAGVELLAASFVVLFLELVFIRWIPTQVRVVAYFPNLVLISAFLGLGIGSLLARRGSVLWLWPVATLLTVLMAIAAGRVAFTENLVSEHLWLLYDDLPETAPVVQGVRIPIVGFFVLSAFCFVPLGQFVASRLNVFRARSSALWGYSLDLGGSLLGVIGFTVISYLRTFPVVWFAILSLVGAVLFLPARRRLLGYALASAFLLVVVNASEKAMWYSPYYSLAIHQNPGEPDVQIRANGSLHQVARTVRMSDPVISERDSINRIGYHFPYRQLRRVPEKVLVLGAGTGNDVSVLLDEGVGEIHAVEIDPVILELGRQLHPDDPYSDPRVTLINNDARSFLNETEEVYDLVVFGTLDSMTRLSALSNVRLDNFVYSRDGIRAAHKRMAADGGMVMYFMVGEPYINDNLIAILASEFGELPALHRGEYHLFNAIYMAGPAFAHLKETDSEVDAWYMANRLPDMDVPSDDWPYLYLPGKGLNGFYMSLMAIFAAIAVLGVSLASTELRGSVRTLSGADGEMFLFGLAFLLMETRFVTSMNLVWGATWITSAVVFGSILAMVLSATVLMKLRPLGWGLAASGLMISLLVTYVVPPELLLSRSGLMRLLLSGAYVGTPIFFASACFALRFRVRERVDLAFGWNLLGAVAGGLIEFFSMSFGLRALLAVAAVAYLGVLFMREREQRSGATTPEFAG